MLSPDLSMILAAASSPVFTDIALRTSANEPLFTLWLEIEVHLPP